MKKCPQCHEDIKFVAIKCRYCRANLVELPTTPKTQQQVPQDRRRSTNQRSNAASATKQISERSRRSKLVLVLLAAAFGLSVIAVGIVVIAGSKRQGNRGGSDAQASTVGHDAGVVVAMVSIEIRGTPTATITFDGHSAGQTPLKVEIPKSTRPITISAVVAGHRPTTSNIIPDHDQLIDLTPPRAPSRRNQQPTSNTPMPSAGSASIVVAAAPAGSAASGSGELIDPYETPQPSPTHAVDNTALERPGHNVPGRGSDELIDPHETHNPFAREGSAGTAAHPPAPAGGVPAECTDYLALVKKIVARCDGVPQDVRDGFNDGGKLLFSTFSRPEQRKTLIEMCKSSAQSLRRMCRLE